MHSGKINYNLFEIFAEERGIFEDTDLATLAHLKNTVLIRRTYIIAHIAQSKLFVTRTHMIVFEQAHTTICILVK